MLRRRRMLGLAVASRSATAVELAGPKGGPRVVRAAEFVFPDEVGLEDPGPLGQALKTFLRSRRFSASRCVIGIDAAHLTARPKTLPPGAEGSAEGILSLAVEREFASDPKDLLFDYTPGSGEDGRASALLVAAPRGHVDHLLAMAQGAGLAVSGVTSSTMALAASANGLMLTDRLVLHVFRGGAELASRSPDGLIQVHRLPVSPPPDAEDAAGPAGAWLDDLPHDLRRAAYGRLGETADRPVRELLVWDETGQPPRAWDDLASQLGVGVRLCASDEARGEAAGGGQYSAAAAIALAGLRGHRLPIDFIHSRLAPRRKLAVSRQVAWGAAAAAAVLVAAALLVLDTLGTEREVADLEGRLAANRPAVTAAEAIVEKAAFARRWYDRRPPLLECLRAVTLTFPAEGGIWATNLRLDETLRGHISGKADTEAIVLDVLDRLKASPRFADVKPLYLREAGPGGREVAFAMSFRYDGSAGPVHTDPSDPSIRTRAVTGSPEKGPSGKRAAGKGAGGP